MTSAWKAIMGEADTSAEVHQTVHDELQNDVIPTIKAWQKTKYVKSMMHIKPTKDLDEEFKRVCFYHRKPIDLMKMKVNIFSYFRLKSRGLNFMLKSTNINENIMLQQKISK
jgi:hypothetical protein